MKKLGSQSTSSPHVFPHQQQTAGLQKARPHSDAGGKAASCPQDSAPLTERQRVNGGESLVSRVDQPFNIVRMSICPKLVNHFHGMTTKIPARFLLGTQEMCVFDKIKVHE